jgi:hypothetical protein
MLHVSNAVVAASLLFQVQNASAPSVYSGVRQVVLFNNTPVPISEIYVSDDNRYVSDDRRDDWQQDLLGSEFLFPNSSMPVYINDQNGNCRVDVKVVLDNGSKFVNRALNICVSGDKPIPVR